MHKNVLRRELHNTVSKLLAHFISKPRIKSLLLTETVKKLEKYHEVCDIALCREGNIFLKQMVVHQPRDRQRDGETRQRIRQANVASVSYFTAEILYHLLICLAMITTTTTTMMTMTMATTTIATTTSEDMPFSSLDSVYEASNVYVCLCQILHFEFG